MATKLGRVSLVAITSQKKLVTRILLELEYLASIYALCLDSCLYLSSNYSTSSCQLFDSSSAHLKYQSLKPRLINLTQFKDGTLICQPVMATYVRNVDLLDRLNKNSDKNFNLYNVWQINLKEFFYFCPWAKLKIV